MVIVDGGDSLEENFILDGETSESDSLSSDSAENDHDEHSDSSVQEGTEPHSWLHDDESAPAPLVKRAKLNWREGAAISSGSVESQLEIISKTVVAFSAYFPKEECPVKADDLSRISFLDCTEYAHQSEKSTSDLFMFLRKQGFLQAASGAQKDLETLILSGSATRAMYLVKELREFDSTFAPLPLFFHGGGRKKEQGSSHESILRGQKTSVAVSLPSRIKSVSDRGLVDYKNVDLIVVDLKTNEKRLNVLSQKDTLRDLMDWVAQYLVPNISDNLKVALI